jgi:hypothetical protein
MTLSEFKGLTGCSFQLIWAMLTLSEDRLRRTEARTKAIHAGIDSRKRAR